MDELVYLSEPERVIMQAITDNVQFDICESERRSNISRFIMRCLMCDSLVSLIEMLVDKGIIEPVQHPRGVTGVTRTLDLQGCETSLIEHIGDL